MLMAFLARANSGFLPLIRGVSPSGPSQSVLPEMRAAARASARGLFLKKSFRISKVGRILSEQRKWLSCVCFAVFGQDMARLFGMGSFN